MGVIAVGLGAAGLLVFASGFLTGVGLQLPAVPAREYTAQAPARPAPAAAPPAAAATGATASASAAPGSTAVAASPVASPAASPASAAVAATAASGAASAPVAAPVALTTPASAANVANTANAANAANTASNACNATAAAPTAAAGSPEFVIQLGAFLDAANAQRLAATLKGRGCTAAVYQITDYQNRTWTVVRLGQFSSLQAAARAAADFKRAEGMLALVRPAGSL